MTNYCFTGPRAVTYGQACQIGEILSKLEGKTWHVGDATGVDKVVADYLRSVGKHPLIYRAEGRQPWQLAARSKAMVDFCYSKLPHAKLIAFPNKACPAGVKPGKSFKGCGSGTWGTIAYAKHLGLVVELHWLTPGLTEPDWMRQEQLTLF